MNFASGTDQPWGLPLAGTLGAWPEGPSHLEGTGGHFEGACGVRQAFDRAGDAFEGAWGVGQALAGTGAHFEGACGVGQALPGTGAHFEGTGAHLDGTSGHWPLAMALWPCPPTVLRAMERTTELNIAMSSIEVIWS